MAEVSLCICHLLIVMFLNFSFPSHAVLPHKLWFLGNAKCQNYRANRKQHLSIYDGVSSALFKQEYEN